jgi:hypothetical protein
MKLKKMVDCGIRCYLRRNHTYWCNKNAFNGLKKKVHLYGCLQQTLSIRHRDRNHG